MFCPGYFFSSHGLQSSSHTADMFDFDADGYREPTADFIDGVTYDGHSPNAYIDSLKIGLKGDQIVADGAVTN